MGQTGVKLWYGIQCYNTRDGVAPAGPVSSPVLLPLTMTTPPDCSAVHMLIMGAMPMVVPWKYTPLQEGGKGEEELQNHHPVPRYHPIIFSLVFLPISNKGLISNVSAPDICRFKTMKSTD